MCLLGHGQSVCFNAGWKTEAGPGDKASLWVGCERLVIVWRQCYSNHIGSVFVIVVGGVMEW